METEGCNGARTKASGTKGCTSRLDPFVGCRILVMLHHRSAKMIFLAMSWMFTFPCELLTCTPASLTGGNSPVIAFPT